MYQTRSIRVPDDMKDSILRHRFKYTTSSEVIPVSVLVLEKDSTVRIDKQEQESKKDGEYQNVSEYGLKYDPQTKKFKRP